MTEEEPSPPQDPPPPADDHAFLRRIFDLAAVTGDCPDVPINHQWWGGWLPEPEHEPKVAAWKRLRMEGTGRYPAFEEVKKWYRDALKQAEVRGRVVDEVFYLALRHFPPL